MLRFQMSQFPCGALFRGVCFVDQLATAAVDSAFVYVAATTLSTRCFLWFFLLLLTDIVIVVVVVIAHIIIMQPCARYLHI